MNLLNIGRIEAGELRLQRKMLDVSTLIEELIAELELYHPGIEKRVQRNLPSMMVNIDEEYIKLAISNILDNAVKYSPPNAPIYVDGEQTEEKAILHIRDTGTGIPHDKLPYIFDKYETSGIAPQTSRRGIGLGLYMTRLLIEAHGGTIWAESAPGQGTTISFSLPRANAVTGKLSANG
jgi:K+-sensing histidine kinase KdpD